MIARLYVLVNVLILALTFSYIYYVSTEANITHASLHDRAVYMHICVHDIQEVNNYAL